MGALTIRESWLSRLLVRAGIVTATEHNAGSDFGTGVAAAPGYSALQAMSAFAAFPWVKACVKAKATDLSGLPLKVIRGTGPDAETITDHPVLDLLARPSTRINGLLFRRQLWVDLDLSGNWYGLMLGPQRPTSILRLHPCRVNVLSSADGQVDRYQYDQRGMVARYPWDCILHMRGPSWEDDPKGLFGTGLIRALHNDLIADLAAQKTASKAARKGRPDSIVRPKDSKDRWTPTQVDLIRNAIMDQLGKAEGGALVLGGAAEYSPLSWSPKDMEFQALRANVREAVLAAAGVPPSRVSLPTANYAQSREMDRTYWQSLKGEAAVINAELTRLAQRWDARDRVIHDFADVPALQEDRTARVDRVNKWWMMGLSLSDAAAYEGFEDLPEPETLSRPSSQDQSTETQPASPSQQSFGSWWRRASPEMPRTEEARSARWRGFIDRIHGPVERGFNLTMRRFLKDQAVRFASRLEEALERSGGGAITRDIETELATILAEAQEAGLLDEAIGGQYGDALERAFKAAMEDLGLEGLTGDTLRMAEATLKVDMIVNVSQTTKDAVSFIVRDGLANGATIQEMQAQIMRSRAFTPARALRIARTETTRAVNRGTVESYREAVQDLPELKMQWLSARDSEVRDSHQDMDGEIAEVDGQFTNPVSGDKAAHPGGFGLPSQDCNCRCGLTPLLGA